MSYFHATLQIFDEILVNAADNTVRAGSGTTKIEVVLDRGSLVHNKQVKSSEGMCLRNWRALFCICGTGVRGAGCGVRVRVRVRCVHVRAFGASSYAA